MPLHVLEHPLSEHLLASLRDVSAQPESFRRLARTLSMLLILEATRSLETREVEVQTPVALASGRLLASSLAAVPVLRAGLCMLEPVLDLFPDVAVGYIGLERHEETAIAKSYYCKLPDLAGKFTLCLDPMLATGGSASQAVSLIKTQFPARVAMVTIVAAPEGVHRFSTDHPEVDIYSAGLDQGLDDRKFIVPGLGDFGDRLYGTL